MGIGKILILVGTVLILIGIVVSNFDRFSFLGKLPGDFNYENGNTKIYIPITTSILVSIALSVIFYFISRLRNN